MKKSVKLIASLIILIMAISILSVCVYAKEDEIDFDKYIEDFVPNSFNVIELKKGETAEARGSIWLSNEDAKVGSSDEDVVTVTKGGKVTAVGYGEAYVVVIASSGGQAQVTQYKVVKEKTLSEFEKSQQKQELFGSIFMVVWCILAVGIVFMFINIVITLSKVSKLKKTMGRVSVEPTQQNAEELLKTLSSIKFIQKFLVSHANEYNGGISKRSFAAVYTNVISQSPYINEATKKGILDNLVGLGCIFNSYVTLGVYKRENAVNDTDNTYNEEEYGDKAEENVWFTLRQLGAQGKANAFTSTRFYCRNIPGQNSQEVDNIVVCRKGIFLIEVKSASHKKLNPVDRSEVVVASDIGDPSMQISMHKVAFLENFKIDERYIKNLLVISYPKDKKKTIDISSFPYNSDYVTLKVDDLYSYISSFNSPDIWDDATVDKISADISKCVNYKGSTPVTKWIINGVEGVAGQTPNVRQSAQPVQNNNTNSKFCPNCGKPIDGTKPFCANCGSKL